MTTSPKLVVANWKSNLNVNSARQWATEFSQAERRRHQYVVCPAFPLLSSLQDWADKEFALGVQDLSPFEAGAYTGAVSAANVEDLHVSYAILGHSERRRYFQESANTVAQKVELALAHGITPILCVDRDQVMAQAAALEGMSASDVHKIVVAYEPVHAISTFGGQEDPLEVTLEAVDFIRQQMNVERVLYGGSVSPENSLAYLNNDQVDGVLVGASSLKVEKFVQL